MTKQQIDMRRTGIAFGAVGVFFALVALPPLHAVAHIFLSIAYWPMSAVPAELLVPLPLMLAISGGLTVGFGAMLWALGTHVAPISPQAATSVATIAGWSWFAVDSLGSIAVGAPFNAVLNLSFLVPLLYVSRTRAEQALPA